MQSYHLDIEKVSILKFLYSLNLNHSPKKLKKTFDILQKIPSEIWLIEDKMIFQFFGFVIFCQTLLLTPHPP